MRAAQRAGPWEAERHSAMKFILTLPNCGVVSGAASQTALPLPVNLQRCKLTQRASLSRNVGEQEIFLPKSPYDLTTSSGCANILPHC